jgi:hypothetical protein
LCRERHSPFLCVICGLKSKTALDFSDHLASHEDGDDRFKLNCKVCDFFAFDKKTLEA